MWIQQGQYSVLWEHCWTSRVTARSEKGWHHSQNACTNIQDRAPFLSWNVQLSITLYYNMEWCDVNPPWIKQSQGRIYMEWKLTELSEKQSTMWQMQWHWNILTPDIPITIECDASGVGVGRALLQNGQPVTFVSRALTSTQKRYSKTKCELLAVVLMVEHLHHYLFSQNFTIHTDHSSLVNVFKKCLNEMSPRLQQLLRRLSQYEMNIKYVTQKHVPIADCLSRLVDARTSEENTTLDL